jgi:late competence protein required for DNA uptake (superfamily II DNA/RNA helicase)
MESDGSIASLSFQDVSIKLLVIQPMKLTAMMMVQTVCQLFRFVHACALHILLLQSVSNTNPYVPNSTLSPFFCLLHTSHSKKIPLLSLP